MKNGYSSSDCSAILISKWSKIQSNIVNVAITNNWSPHLMKLAIWDYWDLVQCTRADEEAIGVGLFLILYGESLESTFQIVWSNSQLSSPWVNYGNYVLAYISFLFDTCGGSFVTWYS